ncbi:MAG: PBP1A family penicillin-binding protein [Alphaproteobacteria bacterium]|nr:PBP1A family penicillin-binding protein [Alphaproteobacteria bacterium]
MASKHPSPPKRTRKKAPPKRSLLGRLFKWAFVLGLWAGIFVLGIAAWYAKDLPDIAKSASFDRKRSIIVKAADGQVVARYGEIIGESVTVKDLPACLPQAVMAIEDRRFYYHFGIDPLGLSRAVVVNVKEGRVAQGGSTITQQLAKNLFLSQERTLKRKIQEAMLAIWLEYSLTKDEILSAYLNRVYLGTGTYGVDAAARLYFDKPVNKLSLRECATLAGMLKAPSRYSPLRNPELANERADLVIQAMVDAGYITKDEAKKEKYIAPKTAEKDENEDTVRFYTDWIVDSLGDMIGTPDEDLVVETTLNVKIQDTAGKAINTALDEAGEAKHISEGAMIVMRPNGEVVALVGGRDYNNSQFNRATQARRPPGSAFKPLVYLTALEQGWDPQDILIDEPITTGRYRPKNFGNRYLGEVTMEQALTYSLNTVAYTLMKEVGPAAVIDTARRMGITADLEADLSLALGSSGVSLLEMANAYATIANGGMSVTPYAITKITSEDGKLYYERAKGIPAKRVFEEYDIQNLTSMMNMVIEHGTGQGANFGVPAAGKTGTSQDSRDAMFMGFTRELVGVVWLGNDDNSPMKNVTGGSYPAKIWREVMSKSTGQYAPFYSRDFMPPSSFERMLSSWFSRAPTVRREHAQQPQKRAPAQYPDSVLKNLEAEMRSIPEGNRYND